MPNVPYSYEIELTIGHGQWFLKATFVPYQSVPLTVQVFYFPLNISSQLLLLTTYSLLMADYPIFVRTSEPVRSLLLVEVALCLTGYFRSVKCEHNSVKKRGFDTFWVVFLVNSNNSLTTNIQP